MAFFTPEARELIDYITDLNEKAKGGFELTTCLKHWAKYGISTKEELGEYLDACVDYADARPERSAAEYHYDVPNRLARRVLRQQRGGGGMKANLLQHQDEQSRSRR